MDETMWVWEAGCMGQERNCMGNMEKVEDMGREKSYLGCERKGYMVEDKVWEVGMREKGKVRGVEP